MMKTAISIPDNLFAEIEAFLKEHGISRSEFFATAAKRYLDLKRGQLMLERLNAVYAEPEVEEGLELRKRAHRHHARSLGKDPW